MAYSTIVVGTDGSETAEQAVAEAAGLAEATGAHLVIATSYKPLTPDEQARLDAETPAEFAWAITGTVQAEEIIRRGREIAARCGVEAEGRIEENERPADGLLDLAGDVKAGLVVVGNKGMTGARRFLVGSVPNYISHKADCDVLIVRTVG